jgi:hypothetical protein
VGTRFDFRNRVARAQAKYRKQGAHHKNLKVKPGQASAYLLRRLACEHPANRSRGYRGGAGETTAASHLRRV